MNVKEAVEEFLIYLESVQGMSENTVKAYKNDLERFMADPGIGTERLMSSITLDELKNCLGRFKSKASSHNRYLSVIRSLFAYCSKRKDIVFNPALELKCEKMNKAMPEFLTGKEVNELRILPVKNPLLWKLRDQALFEVMYSSGCRLAEVAGLKIKDFSENFEVARVCGKGRKIRFVYFEKYVVEIIKKYIADRNERFKNLAVINPEDYLFVNQNGTPLSRGGIAYILTRYTGDAGSKKHVNPHELRHTFATAMLTGGADIRQVQELLGHSSISTTQRYTHVMTDRLIYMYNRAHPHGGNKD